MPKAQSLLVFLATFSQVASSWNTTIELLDTSRTSLLHRHGRTVRAIVCAKDDTQDAPLYVFGHGFDCLGADYAWLCETPGLVTALVMSSDLTPFLPDTKDLALDQAFLSTALPPLAQNASSELYKRLSGKAVLGGHSMGGGTSVLAGDAKFAPHGTVDAIAEFAPGLYTNPPAYSHKKGVQAPIMIVSGAMDCGPNQLPKEAFPLYRDVISTKKSLVVLKGANHCQWSTPTHGGVCSVAECHALERSAQQDAGRRLLSAFLPAALSNSTESWAQFESFLAAGTKRGEWAYLTMNSAPGTNLTNNCPCKK